MKLNQSLRYFVFLFVIAVTLQAFADSGKFWIGRPGLRWRRPSYQTYYPPNPISPYNLPPDYFKYWQNQNNCPDPQSQNPWQNQYNQTQLGVNNQNGYQNQQYQNQNGYQNQQYQNQNGYQNQQSQNNGQGQQNQNPNSIQNNLQNGFQTLQNNIQNQQEQIDEQNQQDKNDSPLQNNTNSLKSDTDDNSQTMLAQHIAQYQDPRGMVIEDFGSGGGAGFGIFTEDRQQAVIAWNGRTDENGEEVLILTTNEQINEKLGKSAITLNVVPLPGEPIDILPANSQIFEKAKQLLNEKYTANDLGSGFPAVMYKKVGSHEIFVWRIDKQENFRNAVLTYVKEKFNGEFVINFTDEMEEVINSYFKRGFRFFAFDLSHVEDSPTTREAIAYHFRSRFVYFPLVISQIGGMPDTSTIVDMIVMTPGRITMKPIHTNKGKVISDENLFVVRKQAVKFTKEEIKKLDPSLEKVMRAFPEVTVRNILLHGDLTGFQNDFMAIGIQ